MITIRITESDDPVQNNSTIDDDSQKDSNDDINNIEPTWMGVHDTEIRNDTF